MKTIRRKSVRFIAVSGLIAALYVVLTMLSATVGLASGSIQFRLSEALCILCVFTPAAIPGITVGCLVSNLLTGCLPPDIILGTAFSAVGAVGTYFLRKHPIISPLPYVLANTLYLTVMMRYVYGKFGTLPLSFYIITCGIGEAVCAGAGGILLYFLIKKKQLAKYLE